MLGHNNLESYYRTIFGLVQHHNYSITELEELMPFELEVYVLYLIEFLKEQEQHQKDMSKFAK